MWERATQCRQMKQELTTLKEGSDRRQKNSTNEDYQKEHRRVIVAISRNEKEKK